MSPDCDIAATALRHRVRRLDSDGMNGNGRTLPGPTHPVPPRREITAPAPQNRGRADERTMIMPPMNRGAKSVLSLAGVVSAALLACGCSLSVDDSSSSATTASTSQTTANAPVSSASTSPRDTTASGAPGQDAGITDPDWLDALSRAELEISTDDADDIVGDDQLLRVAVDCPEVEITGSNNTVVARTAPEVTVTGANNTVYVMGVMEVTINGAGNTIVWSGDSAPEVEQVGTDNVVRRAG